MSCKYKNSECLALCDVINGYCLFETMDETCPIYYAYIDFDKVPSGDGIVHYGKIISAAEASGFKSRNFNLNIRKNI